MNNGKSNTKGPDMRRLVALVLMVAFCVAFLSPPASATQYDPNHWPLVHVVNQGTPSGDDSGWTNPDRDNPTLLDRSILFFVTWLLTDYAGVFLDDRDREQNVLNDNGTTDDRETATDSAGGSL